MVERELKILSVVFILLISGYFVYYVIESHSVGKLKEDFQTMYLNKTIHPTKLYIVRKGIIQDIKKQPKSTYIVDDADSTNDIFSSILSLKDAPRGIINCPIDFGITYNLSFYQNNKLVYQATVSGGGCQFIKLPNRTVSSNQHFWNLMQQATHLNGKQLWGSPGSF